MPAAAPSRIGSSPAPSGRAVVIVVLLVAVLGLAAGAFLLRGGDPARPFRGPRPNIVVMVWDTTRADRLSCYGHDRPTTPWLDSVAAGGVLFEQCIAPAPWTAPSHASLFTGLLPVRHGLDDARGARLRQDIPTLAGTLSRAGYETFGVSSNSNVSLVNGLSRGFETWERVWQEGRKADALEVLEKVEAWLAARKARGEKRPVFVFLNFMDPHLPLLPPQEDLDRILQGRHDDDALNAAAAVTQGDAFAHLLRLRVLPESTLAALRDLYDGSLRHLDRVAGTIAGRLEQEGLMEGALLAVTSDHGENLGDHGLLEHRMSVNESVLRVPMVLRWKGRAEGGRREKGQVRLQDLFTTVLAAAGEKVPAGTGLDSLDLLAPPGGPRTAVARYGPQAEFLPAIRRSFPTAPEEAFAPFRRSWLAVRDPADAAGPRKWILLRHHPVDGEPVDEKQQLFDPVADPGERHDLLGPDATPADREAALRLRKRAGELGVSSSRK